MNQQGGRGDTRKFRYETGMRVILSNMRIGEVVELKSDRNGGMVARVVWYVMGSEFAGTYDARGYLVGLYPHELDNNVNPYILSVNDEKGEPHVDKTGPN